MIMTRIVDGYGSGIQQRVFPNGSSLTISNGFPPFGELWPITPFVSLLKSSAGSSDMRVAGTAANPIEFFVNASTSADRFITAISFFISDAGANLNQFGAISALTNGCLLIYETPNTSTQVLPALKSNFDFLRMAFGQPSFGDNATAFQAVNAVASSEAYIPVIKFSDWLPPFGLKLDINSGNRIVMKIQDNTTGVDAFDAIVFGFDRAEEKHTKKTVPRISA